MQKTDIKIIKEKITMTKILVILDTLGILE